MTKCYDLPMEKEIAKLSDDDLEKELHFGRLALDDQFPESIAWLEALVREDERRKMS